MKLYSYLSKVYQKSEAQVKCEMHLYIIYHHLKATPHSLCSSNIKVWSRPVSLQSHRYRDELVISLATSGH